MYQLFVVTKINREIIDITERIQLAVSQEGLGSGLVSLFLPHTTAGLTTAGMESGSDINTLTAFEQGPEHATQTIISSLLGSSLTIPVKLGQLSLGSMQRIALVELNGPQQREINLTFIRTES
jgi:secondary thiamine-phosphate synthase enzyme